MAPITHLSGWTIKAIIAAALLMACISASHAKNGIAVVKNRYDNVELVLDNYRIEYEVIKLVDLEKAELMKQYRAIYLPSGVDSSIESSINVLARSSRIESVSLKSDYQEADQKKIAENLRTFVEKGGAVYASGYSYKYLQGAFNSFRFYEDFPFIGMSDRIVATLYGDLLNFNIDSRFAMYFNYPGWIVIKSARDAEVLAKASTDTARGKRDTVVTAFLRRGAGVALYTCYDSTVHSEFRRYNIYRIAGAQLIDSTVKLAEGKWGQKASTRLCDAVHNGEPTRIYAINLSSGTNTVYFKARGGSYQIDILDENRALLVSTDIQDREQIIDIPEGAKDYCYVKIYPSSESRYDLFAIVSAHGIRSFPYFFRTVLIGGIIIVLAIAITVRLLFFGKRYSGRFR